ncbi:inositol monophosphatase family protein [Legionella dresdenensis]|uniref:Inositol monophosphatase family protein n=1 Tax=Legionella dresdenensis TaxID=450200 RepID=A0ABV8CB94_9GAMM
MKSFNQLAAFAELLAKTGGEIAMAGFRKPITITLKDNGSAVTEIDLAIESALKELITTHYPEHGIWGEEFGRTTGNADYQWVIDPIDGTAAFSCGKPGFCLLIALLFHNKPVLGVIYQPFSGEQWIGYHSEAAYLNQQRCYSNRFVNPERIRLSCTTPAMFASSELQEKFNAVARKAAVVSYGGDAYSYGLLASGYIDIILEADLQYYDVAALIPIVEGAGGVITDWEGKAIEPETFDGRCIAAANEELLEMVVESMRGAASTPLEVGR